MVLRVNDQAKESGTEIDIQDGFDLYRQFTGIRRLFTETLPDVPFPFRIEELLKDFVWRWIQLTDQRVVDWAEQAVKQDSFTVRTSESMDTPDELKHSVSVIDVFRSFNEVVEQLKQLEWNDEFQYAKFMTALSKSIGNGVGVYCDALEQLFTKEMDRLSPEQEAAMHKTTQEKWMQMAKDAWANKEKIEPFQFYPEVGNYS